MFDRSLSAAEISRLAVGDAEVSLEQLREAVADAGYKVPPIKPC